ncbi:MAG: tRNA (adenosine(37)-N6)-threonylcarbamoyltransferase complex dimerization subunit type 1 TsaB [Bacillota bacterium]
MKLMALSTSGPVASVALYAEDSQKGVWFGAAGRAHSETLFITIDDALGEAGMQMNEFDAFAVDVGPGSFTGVRIGVSAANALAYACGCSVIEVDSLTALYHNASKEPRVCALLDARNGNGYASLFLEGKSVGPEAVSIAEYLKAVPENTLFLGDGAELHATLIRELTKSPHFAPEKNMLSALGVIDAAIQKLSSGDRVRAATPLYLRPSQAERMYETRYGH